MRVLITGATGFVGGWLAEELSRAFPSAALFGTSHAALHGAFAAGPAAAIRLLPCDLTDTTAVEAAIAEAKPDCVFHLAGFASGAGTDRERIFRVNVNATVSLLDMLRRQERPCRVLLASSGYIYGATSSGSPAKESDTPAPSGAYAESKAAMETAVRPYAAPDGPLSITITRSFNHTGPRQTTDFVIPAFARQIARIERGLDPPVVRVGNLDASRDFLYVADVVRAYRMLILETDAVPWRVVNVASGTGIAIRSMLDGLIAMSSVPVTVESDPARMRPSDLPECVGDSSLLRALTGWTPESSIDDLLTRTLDYWRGQAAADAA